MDKILITGGTGLVGKHLEKLLTDKGYEVAILSRSPTKENQYKWDIHKNYIDEKALENTNYIIHLAGAGIADKRWTPSRKKVLIDSRVESANLLFNKVKEFNTNLKGFISASGIGYYGAITSEIIFTEDDKPENDFISEICVKWEASAKQFEKLNVPTTILRTGIVLTKSGGALAKINTPFFLSILGNGKQYMPWIHITDLCNLYLKAIEDSNFTGIYNAVAPEHHTNISFTKALSKVTKKPLFFINIPSFLLKLIFGEMSDILLNSSRVSSKKTASFFKFKFGKLRTALE